MPRGVAGFNVTVTNTSGFDWTSTQDGCYSCTGFYLNIHFTDSPYSSQSTSEWLTAAETLSFSLANGQSMTFALDLTAPSAGTHYIQAVVDDYGQENANPGPPDSVLDPSVGVAASVS